MQIKQVYNERNDDNIKKIILKNYPVYGKDVC